MRWRSLSQPRQVGRLDWYLEYSASETYGMTRLAPQDWHTFTVRLENEPAFFNEYYNYRYKSYLGTRTCTGTCVQDEVCRLRTSYGGQPACV